MITSIQQAVRNYFVFLGRCARIAFVGDLSQPWYLRRYEGYPAALKSKGLGLAVVNLEGEPDAEELGRRALPILLRQHPRTTAVLAQDDETACGLLEAMNKLGIRAPENLSLVGYDDIAEIRYLRPALTTVRVPKEKIGWTMADLLFQAIRAHEGPTVVGVATSLIIVFLVVNVLVDLLHSVLDPRIRHV